MNELFILSLLGFAFISYKMVKVLMNKEVPADNRRIAWVLYGTSVLGLVIVNMFFS